ncbi:tyrosine-type recombinase/integrase [Dactylosporangium sp. NPDC005555]|uniref:tyrosine-type recombinase/integrase n=1 Tax=Dactylosporangium sp. NPDC005555 TaxID=3154889 RepID=UPI00339DBFB3
MAPGSRDDDTKKILDACKGESFVNLRDEALIRLYCNTGARLSEVGNLLLTDLDLNTE